MSRLLQRLNLLAILLLGGTLASVLVVRMWPAARLVGQIRSPEGQWDWWKTLHVCPSHPGDPVKLVKILKDGKEIVPGTYKIPEASGDMFQVRDALTDWLRDISFVLKNESPKTVVAVGMAVVFPTRRTDYDNRYIAANTSAPDVWLARNPHYCDGGCPNLLMRIMHWGRMPAQVVSALQAGYDANGTELIPLQGKEPLQFAPGEQIALSLPGRVDGFSVHKGWTEPPQFTGIVNGILSREGIAEARDAEPCRMRAISQTGCAFAKVSEFNIGLDIVYFEDGSIWGNYGYGYALPNPDGIHTRVQAHDSQGSLSAAPAPN